MSDPRFIRSTLATLDLPGMIAAFNTVYQRYVVPFAMDQEQMGRHLASTVLDLAHSPLWLDHCGTVVRLAALGVRSGRGWLGGFGLSPAYRGSGLGRILLQESLTAARALALRQVELEVLCQNEAAIRVYTLAGFRIAGDLSGMALPHQAPRAPGASTTHDADAQALLARLPTLRPEAACWQREPATLAAGREPRHCSSATTIGRKHTSSTGQPPPRWRSWTSEPPPAPR